MNAQEVDTKNLPFLVHRTVSGNLPVYVEPTKRGEKFTRVRRVFGDAEHLARELSRLCGAEARVGRGGRKAVEAPRISFSLLKEIYLEELIIKN